MDPDRETPGRDLTPAASCAYCGRINSAYTRICPRCENRLDTSTPSEPWVVLAEEVPCPEPASPGIGIWHACGWLLALWLVTLMAGLVVGFMLGIVLASQLRVQGIEPYRPFLIVVGCALFPIVAAVLGWLKLGSQAERKLAIRRPGVLHLLLVILLVFPLTLIAEEIVNRAAQAIDAVFGAEAQVHNILQPAPLCPPVSSAYVYWFAEANEALLQQPWIVLLLVGCVLPGVGEEVFFRGFLGRGLIARYGVVRGTLATSVLFGLMHIDPVQVCCTIVLGVVLHVVYLSSKSLWAPMLLHTLHNGVALSSEKFIVEGAIDFVGPEGTVPVPPLLLLAALAAAVAAGFVFYQTRIRWVMPDGQEWSPGYVTAEMPPAGTAAAARHKLPRLWAILVPVGAYLAFGAVLAQTITTWLDPQTAWAYASRGDAHSEKGEYGPAIAAYDEAIRLDPKSAWAYAGRADAYRMMDENDKALADCDRAIQLDPEFAFPHAVRGEVLRLMGDRGRALADCSKAIGLDSQFAWAYSVRGSVYFDDGEYGPAIADWKRAVNLDPEHAWTYDSLAWALAVCPESIHRDAAAAVRYATKACELTDWTDACCLATLAAAHAECGQFDQAVRWQRQALRLAPAEQKADFQSQLESYQQGRVGEL